MKPGVARALLSLAALGALGGGGSGIEQPGFSRRRARPEPPRAPESGGYWHPSQSTSPLEDIERFRRDSERVRLATELRARRAAKLERLVAKGAIRRAGT